MKSPIKAELYDPATQFKNGWHFAVFAACEGESPLNVLKRASGAANVLSAAGKEVVLIKHTESTYLVGHDRRWKSNEAGDGP